MRLRKNSFVSVLRGENQHRFAVSLCLVAATVASGTAGCDDDSFLDTGRDYGARAGSEHRPGPQQFWVPLGKSALKAKPPELLAPTDASPDKLPVIADPDALAAGDTGLVEKMPDPMSALDSEDHVAGNFKYSKSYRDPLLPSHTAGEEKELQDLRTDSLSLEDGSPIASGSRLSRGVAPAGPLGELQRQREERAKHRAERKPDKKDVGATDSSDEDISVGLLTPDPIPDSGSAP